MKRTEKKIWKKGRTKRVVARPRMTRRSELYGFVIFTTVTILYHISLLLIDFDYRRLCSFPRHAAQRSRRGFPWEQQVSRIRRLVCTLVGILSRLVLIVYRYCQHVKRERKRCIVAQFETEDKRVWDASIDIFFLHAGTGQDISENEDTAGPENSWLSGYPFVGRSHVWLYSSCVAAASSCSMLHSYSLKYRLYEGWVI